jgi:hypothetical protein
MKTLLRVPDLIKAIEPFVKGKVLAEDIFRLIGNGNIKPLGFVQRMPVFDLGQIADVATVVNRSKEHSTADNKKGVTKCQL